MTRYFVVEFPEEQNTLAVVPVSWLENENCAWPPGSTKTVAQLARCCILPDQTWKRHKATVVCESKSYEKASKKLEKYRYDSDVNFTTDINSATAERPSRVTNCAKSLQGALSQSSSCTTCADNQEILKQILRSVESLAHMVTENSAVLQKLGGCVGEKMPDIECLPLTSFEEVLAFNQKLEDDGEMSKLVKYLGLLGGRDEKEATRRILSEMFVHDVALQLSWAGSEKKKSLQELHNIYQLVAVSVRQSKQFQSVTQMSINETIKRWFRSAGDRQGGRVKRQMKIKKKKCHFFSTNVK